MDKVILTVFQKDCMGCHACEVACKQEHSLYVGPRLIKVLERSPRYVPVYCHHCARPPCRESCPTEAIFRENTGVVLINNDLCIGCKACVEACPFGAMQYDERAEIALKCNLCHERIVAHEKTACQNACPTGCILVGAMKEVYAEIETRLTQQRSTSEWV